MVKWVPSPLLDFIQSTFWKKNCLFSNYFTHRHTPSFLCQFPVFLSAEWLREHHFLCRVVLQKACTLRVGYFDFEYTEEIDSRRGKICLQVTTPNNCSSLIKVSWMYILSPPSTSPLSLKVLEQVGHSVPVFYLLCCDLHLPMLFVSGSVTFLEPKHTKEPTSSTSYYEWIVCSPQVKYWSAWVKAEMVFRDGTFRRWRSLDEMVGMGT